MFGKIPLWKVRCLKIEDSPFLGFPLGSKSSLVTSSTSRALLLPPKLGAIKNFPSVSQNTNPFDLTKLNVFAIL